MAAVGHGLSRSAILVLLVLLFRSLGVINDLGPCVSLGGTVQSAFVPGKFLMFPGNVFFPTHSLQAQQTGTNIVYSTHKGLDSLDFQLLLGLECTHKNLWSCKHAGTCCCKKC